MTKRLTGLNPLAYIGVEPLSPPQSMVVNRAPTTTDTNFNLGTIWLVANTEDIYMLTINTIQLGAIWTLLSAGATILSKLIADGGTFATPDPVTHAINTFGDGLNISVVGDDVHTTTTTLNLVITINGILFPDTTAGFGAGYIKMNNVVVFHDLGHQNHNIYVGALAGNSTIDTTATNYNAAFGYSALNALTTGSSNTAIGANTLFAITSGSNNIAIGASSGSTYLGGNSSNIVIGNSGVTGESNKLRIGTTGSGAGEVNEAFIAGIYNVTPGGTTFANVIIDENGQLGTGSGAGIVEWLVVSVDTTIVGNIGYIANNNMAPVVFTMPTTAPVGTIIRIVGLGTGLWEISLNDGQNIVASSEINVGTIVASTFEFDTIEMVCAVANTTFIVLSSSGNLDYT